MRRWRGEFLNFALPLNGAQRWNRTTDTRIFSPLLYQLSYLGTRVNILLLNIFQSKRLFDRKQLNPLPFWHGGPQFWPWAKMAANVQVL